MLTHPDIESAFVRERQAQIAGEIEEDRRARLLRPSQTPPRGLPVAIRPAMAARLTSALTMAIADLQCRLDFC